MRSEFDARPPPPDRPRWLRRLSAALSRWNRPTAPTLLLEPATAAEELVAWSRDDGRWQGGRTTKDWRSLLDDVDAAWSRLGPHLRDAVSVEPHLPALRGVRAARIVSEPEHRAIVRDAAGALHRAFEASEALVAAADDVFDAARQSRRPDSLDDETQWRLALLASVGERHGHDWAVVADRVRRALDWGGGRRGDEMIAAVRRALRAPRAEGHSIVWLAIEHAWAWGPSPNPAVQLINGDWLLAVLRQWDGPRDGVPPEIAADPQRLLGVRPRVDEDADVDEQLPVSFARVDLGTGPTAGARERARDILELLIARASVRQRGTNWRVSGVCLHFVDGELIFESHGSIGDPDIYNRLRRGDVVHDPTGETINEEARRLGDRLPVQDARVHAALQLAQWLSSSRPAPPPARLVLSGRIIEQAANWADVSVGDLVDEYLAPAWAISRIAADLSRAGAAAVLRLPGANGLACDEQQRQTFLDQSRALLDERRERGRPRARPWQVLGRLDWLVDQHSADTAVGDYLRELRQRLHEGQSAAAWIDELLGEAATLNARAVRTRNAIVHGGPLIADVARTVVDLRDALASQALEWVMDALVASRPLPAAFGEYRARYAASRERLRRGGDPLVELAAAAATP